MSLAASINHSFRHTLEGKHVPEDQVPAIRELIARHQTQAHVKADGANCSLTDELGLADYPRTASASSAPRRSAWPGSGHWARWA